jgi:hypothetical protein
MDSVLRLNALQPSSCDAATDSPLEGAWLARNEGPQNNGGMPWTVSAWHPDRIPFDSLRREDQVFLVDLGFPSQEAATFKKNVREILDGIGRQRKPRRPVRRGTPPQWISARAMRAPMAMMAHRSRLGLLAETNLRPAHSIPIPTPQSMRQRPLAIPQMKAGDPDIRQARHRDNATHSSASRICRVVADVETQCCEHLFLVGNRECMIERPLLSSRTTALD